MSRYVLHIGKKISRAVRYVICGKKKERSRALPFKKTKPPHKIIVQSYLLLFTKRINSAR